MTETCTGCQGVYPGPVLRSISLPLRTLSCPSANSAVCFAPPLLLRSLLRGVEPQSCEIFSCIHIYFVHSFYIRDYVVCMYVSAGLPVILSISLTLCALLLHPSLRGLKPNPNPIL